MTVETRTALLVGLAIIILFGLILGQRSLQVASVSAADGPAGVIPAPAPGGEVMAPRVEAAPDRPVLSPPRPVRPAPAAPAAAAAGRSASTQPAARPPTPQRPGQRAHRAGPKPAHYSEVTLKDLSERFGPARRERVYVVRRGDCLTNIARSQMGDAGPPAVRRLYQANRDRIDDPDRLPVGLKLRIPG